jgi:hypothetical protein
MWTFGSLHYEENLRIKGGEQILFLEVYVLGSHKMTYIHTYSSHKQIFFLSTNKRGERERERQKNILPY